MFCRSGQGQGHSRERVRGFVLNHLLVAHFSGLLSVSKAQAADRVAKLNARAKDSVVNFRMRVSVRLNVSMV